MEQKQELTSRENHIRVLTKEMGDAGFFKGTTAEQDNRFVDKKKKLMRQMKFGEGINRKVDITKVNIDSLKPWIAQRITQLLQMEDDVLVEFVYNQLEERYPDAKEIQINLTGFLNPKNARIFLTELWNLLCSAQENDAGIPSQFLEQKKEEIRKRQAEQERVNAALKRKDEQIKEQLTKQKERIERQVRSPEKKKALSPSSRHNVQRVKAFENFAITTSTFGNGLKQFGTSRSADLTSQSLNGTKMSTVAGADNIVDTNVIFEAMGDVSHWRNDIDKVKNKNELRRSLSKTPSDKLVDRDRSSTRKHSNSISCRSRSGNRRRSRSREHQRLRSAEKRRRCRSRSRSHSRTRRSPSCQRNSPRQQSDSHSPQHRYGRSNNRRSPKRYSPRNRNSPLDTNLKVQVMPKGLKRSNSSGSSSESSIEKQLTKKTKSKMRPTSPVRHSGQHYRHCDDDDERSTTLSSDDDMRKRRVHHHGSNRRSSSRTRQYAAVEQHHKHSRCQPISFCDMSLQRERSPHEINRNFPIKPKDNSDSSSSPSICAMDHDQSSSSDSESSSASIYQYEKGRPNKEKMLNISALSESASGEDSSRNMKGKRFSVSTHRSGNSKLSKRSPLSERHHLSTDDCKFHHKSASEVGYYCASPPRQRQFSSKYVEKRSQDHDADSSSELLYKKTGPDMQHYSVGRNDDLTENSKMDKHEPTFASESDESGSDRIVAKKKKKDKKIKKHRKHKQKAKSKINETSGGSMEQLEKQLREKALRSMRTKLAATS